MSKKTTLIIDLRPIQSGKLSGVTISNINWITELIKQTSSSSLIYLWTNSIKTPVFPKSWLKSKNVKHIHTKIPNKLLNLSLSRLNYPKIDKLLKVEANSYFCGDLRPFSVSKKVKSTIYIHDIAFIKHKSFYSTKSKIWYKLINPKKIYEKASAIMTNSTFSKNEIKNEFGEKTINIVHPSLDESWHAPKKQIIKNYFVICSTLEPRKNIQKTIEGFNQFNKDNLYKLLIIGTYDKTFKSKNYTKNKNIKFLGFVSESKKKKIISESSGLIYLSQYEGFGLPILEALTLNTPALCSNIEVFSELYENYVTKCDQNDPSDIAKGILKIANKKQINNKKFNIQKETKKMIKYLM